ncbi:MAG: hypothetical protein JNN07_15340 [Verrucomicrobiales bacterium]|nr:hypothetical protein [Verrucomicrobiales bacterium]
MNTSILLIAALAWMGHALTSSAQDFAIESPRFTWISNRSSDETFAIVPQGGPLESEPMASGEFSLTGSFGSLAPAVPRPTGGENLLPHGDAEGLVGASGYSVATLPGWTLTGNLQVVRWDTEGGFPVLDGSGPGDPGVNFFAGGDQAEVSTATIRIDLSGAPASSGDGPEMELSGWFGGYGFQDDTATLTATFLDPAGAALGSFRVGGFTGVQRQNRTRLLYDSTAFTMPASARQVELTLELRRYQGNYNDGYADNLRLAFRQPSEEGLRVDASLQPDTGLELSFVSEPGRIYSLESVEDLGTPAWENLPGTQKPGTGSVIRYQLPNTLTQRQKFFRVRVGP